MKFEILDGPFEGVEYEINTAEINLDGDKWSFDYKILTDDLFYQRSVEMLERIISGDILARIESGIKEVKEESTND